MIILDTNVISEMIKEEPHQAVETWLNQQAAETLYLTSVTVAELLFGFQVLPDGRRKAELAKKVDAAVALFDRRILTFDVTAARHYAELAVKARTLGKGFPVPDGYIAAIAAANHFIVATRDTAPFAAAGVKVINPWLQISS